MPRLKRLASEKFARWHVALLTVLLTGLAYGSYFLGIAVPHGDFMASYLTEPRAWWARGGLFDPPEWISYAWMGYPSDSSLQNSSYYLPIGVIEFFWTYTPYSAAILSALTTAVGAVGMYVLCRRMFENHPAALVGLVAWFFNPLVFSNAQHVDIARASALLPWLLLVASPWWPWHKLWSIPVATLVLWQWMIGAYPGQLVAAAYVMPLWVLATAATERRARWLLGLAASGVAAVMLSLLKYGPALALGSGADASEVGAGQSATVDATILATFFYPYDFANMPNDTSMRSYFLVVPVLLLVVLVRRQRNLLGPVVMVGTAAIVTVLSVFADDMLSLLPGLGLSRFRAIDFKAFLAAGLILIAVASLTQLLDREREALPARVFWVRVTPLLLVALALGATLRWESLRQVLSSAVLLMLLAAGTFLVAKINSSPATATARWLPWLIAVSVLSGLVNAYSVTSTWAGDRERLEPFHYGKEVSRLIAPTDCDATQKRRPPRMVPPDEVSELYHSTVALRGAYSCEEAIGGYLNIKGNPVRAEQDRLLQGPSGPAMMQFFSAPGAVVPVAEDGTLDVGSTCLIDGRCDGLQFEPVHYSQEGQSAFLVSAERPLTVAVNDSYYPGWELELCRPDGSACNRHDLTSGPWHSIELQLAEGTHLVKLNYEAPQRPRWAVVGATGVTLTLLAVGTHWLLRRRAQARSNQD